MNIWIALSTMCSFLFLALTWAFGVMLVQARNSHRRWTLLAFAVLSLVIGLAFTYPLADFVMRIK